MNSERALPKIVPALDELVDVEELVEVEEDARHVGDEEHADHAHQDHPQLQVLRLKQREQKNILGPKLLLPMGCVKLGN